VRAASLFFVRERTDRIARKEDGRLACPGNRIPACRVSVAECLCGAPEIRVRANENVTWVVRVLTNRFGYG